jgi:hypothetical protein
MSKEEGSYDQVVKKEILKKNNFDIRELRHFESIKSIIFVRSEYSKIKALIAEGNMEGVKKLPDSVINTNEYLDIIQVSDQNDKNYIVTIYDNNELWQDPEIIDIFPLE